MAISRRPTLNGPCCVEDMPPTIRTQQMGACSLVAHLTAIDPGRPDDAAVGQVRACNLVSE